MICGLLDSPTVYRLAQTLLAPGAASTLRRLARRRWEGAQTQPRVLDVGCGPRSLLADFGGTTFGVDLSPPYLRVFREGGGHGALASADRLPFADGSFDSVWSFGLLHHLPDAAAGAAVAEMVRVCRAGGGRVVVFDGVYPRRWWTRPLPHLIRKYDRGRFMRGQDALQALFPDRDAWTFERRTSAYTGLELLIACLRLDSTRGLALGQDRADRVDLGRGQRRENG